MVSLFSYEAVAETLKAIFPQLSVVICTEAHIHDIVCTSIYTHTCIRIYVILHTYMYIYIVYTCMYIHIVVVFEENSRKRKYHK